MYCRLKYATGFMNVDLKNTTTSRTIAKKNLIFSEKKVWVPLIIEFRYCVVNVEIYIFKIGF